MNPNTYNSPFSERWCRNSPLLNIFSEQTKVYLTMGKITMRLIVVKYKPINSCNNSIDLYLASIMDLVS